MGELVVERLVAALRNLGPFAQPTDAIAVRLAAEYDRLTGEFEEREHDARIDMADGYVPPRTDQAAPLRYDLLVASARVLRVIEDPVLDGADEWLVGSTFEGDYERVLVGLIIEALIKEGMVERRDGRLYPVPHEKDEG